MIRFLAGAASYPLAVVVSLCLHGLLVFFLLGNWAEPETKRRVIKPKFVEAKLIQIEPKVVEKPQPVKPKAKPKPKPKVDNQAAKRRAEEKARKAREAKLKKQREAERLKKKKLEEKRRQEALAKQREAAKKAEQLRKQQELARQQAEQQRLEQEAMEFQLVDSYSSYINERIASNWSRPPSARRGMVVELELQLAPNGQVVNVYVAKSSGNEAFDRSAEQAVRKVDRFDRLRELESAVFERNFRKLRLRFSPDDLRL